MHYHSALPRLAAGVMASGVLVLTSVTDVRAETCEADGEKYVCGEIIVGLYDDADVTIEEVVERNGGDPDSDIVNRVENIRAYTLWVGEGNEEASIDQYSEDPAVEYATLNGTEGQVVSDLPDTAVSGAGALNIDTAAGLVMTLMAAALAAGRLRSALL